MAEAPQMAKPVPISRLRAAPSFIRFPSHVVTTSVPTRVPATRATVPSPSAMIEPNDTANPSRTMPIRSSRLVTAARPRFADRRAAAGVAGDHAQGDGPGEDADGGHEPVGEHRAAEPECGGDQARPPAGRRCPSVAGAAGRRRPARGDDRGRCALRRRSCPGELEHAAEAGPVQVALDRAVTQLRRSASTASGQSP